MKKLTLTIGIPTLNEEKNIENILQQILAQKDDNFILKKILVYSDASTDKTHEKVAFLAKKYTQIILIKGLERKGKYIRVNELFQLSKTDVLVILDADIGLVGKNFLRELINVFISDPNALLVAAHQRQLRAKTFIGKLIYAHLLMWDYIRWSIPHYHSARNYYGSATGYRGSFAGSVSIPSTIIDPHLYIYLSADIKNGFRYCEKAVMIQWPVSTLHDFRKLLRRSFGKRDEALNNIFGEKYIESTRFVPSKYKLIGIIKALRQEPIYTPLSFFISLYAKFEGLMPKDKTSVWDIVLSTKQEIKN